jgi:protein involved in polysaccharide export with SLBB domain
LSSKNKAVITSAQGDNYELSRKLSESHILRHGDSVMIPMYEPMPETIYTLSISGGVKKPGVYSFKKGATLHEMIAIAGGFSETAYPFGGALYRKKAAEIQRDSFEKSYSQLINFLATNTSRGSAVITNSQNLQVVLAELRAAKFKGRISAEFSSRKIAEDPSLDTVLADQDEIHIPEFTSDVYVSGDILNPGGRRYDSELDLYDYINQSGGLSRFADSERIIIIKPNGDADVVKASRLFSSSSTIYPGSTIFVPKEIGKLEGISYVATLAPIVSSLALSLASLNSIN